MKRTFKKSLSLVLAIVMVMTALPLVGATAKCATCNYTVFESQGGGWHKAICGTCNSFTFENCAGGTATCASGAICDKCKTAYTEPTGAHGETTVVAEPEYIKTPANCKYPAVYYKVCMECGQKTEETANYGLKDPNSHVYGVGASNNNRTHRAACEYCTTAKNDIPCDDAAPVVTPAGCTTTGKTVNTCDSCGYKWDVTTPATGHTYTVQSTVLRGEASCKEGKTYWLACACGALARDDSNAQDKYVDVGGKTDHVYNQEVMKAEYLVVAATCQQAATYYKSCVCGEKAKSITDTFLGATGAHTWNEGVYNNDAKCGVDGTKNVTCIILGCGATDKITAEGTALTHKFERPVEAEDRLVESGNCLVSNVYYYTCNYCDVYSNDYRERFSGQTKGAHDFTSTDINEYNYTRYLISTATCKERAVAYKFCAHCGLSSKGTPEEDTFTFGDLQPHQYQAITKDKFIRVNATCTEGAIYTISCVVCEEPKVAAGVDPYAPGINIPAEDIFVGNPLGHLHEKIKDQIDPSCVSDGRTEEWECQRDLGGRKCGNKVGGEAIAKLEHQFKVTQEFRYPTCKRNGQYGQKKCDMCGTIVTFDANGETVIIPSLNMTATGHVDSDGDMICEKCDALLEAEDLCECICHMGESGGLMYFVVWILKWFWKLTGANEYCACGNLHY